jgi:hypothetical protein
MKTIRFLIQMTLTLTVMVLCVCNEAQGAKLGVNLNSANLEQEGFVLTTAKRDDGTIDVTLTRQLSKARSFDATSDLELVRNATLEVSGQDGVLVRCNIASENTNGTAVYHFQVAPAQFSHSKLIISEIDDYKKRDSREHLLGGGTIFTLQLSDVATSLKR